MTARYSTDKNAILSKYFTFHEFYDTIEAESEGYTMQMKDRTKLMFAEELEKLLETKPFDKVRVLDLCRQCGTTPQTFYYHFKDKYELAAWVFLHDFAYIVGDTEPDYSPERIAEMTAHMVSRHNFYQKAYNDHSQNAINKYMFDFNLKNAQRIVKEVTGEDLTAEQTVRIKYHIYGIMGLFYELIYETLEVNAAEMSAFLYEKTPDFLKASFEQYRYSSEDILNTEK